MTSPAHALPLAIGWFSREEWPRAIDRWPDLTDEMPLDHRAYCEAIEARTKRLARHLTGHRLAMTPLSVDVLEAEAADEETDAAQTRAHVAARQLQEGLATAWPPARNDPCWCDSGRKYKQCCGPIPAAADETAPAEEPPGPEAAPGEAAPDGPGAGRA